MITCIKCQQSWEAEPRHADDCQIPAVDILRVIHALERKIPGAS